MVEILLNKQQRLVTACNFPVEDMRLVIAEFRGDLAPNSEAYKFMIWAKDLDPDADDTFRIKIWWEDGNDEETLVYDNGFDQAIGGGSIMIHTK